MAEQSFKIYKDTAERLEKNALDIASLKEDLSELNTSVFNIKESPNIFDKTKINQDKALVVWGTPTMTNYTYDKTGWVTSYPIAVHGGSTIHVYKFENGSIKNQDIANLITFTKDGSFIAIEGQGKNEIKLSENTAYIIFDIISPKTPSLVLQVRINVLKQSRLPERIRHISTVSTRKTSDGQIGHSTETGRAQKERDCKLKRSRSWLLNSLSIHTSRIKDG